MVDRYRLAAAALPVLIAALSMPVRCEAQGHLWRPETRFLVSDGGIILALGAGSREVFALTPDAILVRDVIRQRWGLPLPLPSTLVGARPTTLAWDAAGGVLWLGTATGDLFTMTPGIGQWDRIPAAATGPIEALVVAPREGALYFSSRGGWRRVVGASFFPETVPASAVPASVLAAARPIPNDPYLVSASATLGQDERGGSWPITGIVAGPDPGLYWVATAGGGLVRFDSRASRRDWIRFGLAGTGAASIHQSGDTLWFGSNGRDPHGGIAFATDQLGHWQQFERPEGAPTGFVAEMTAAFGRMWFASSDGLFHMSPDRTARRPFERLTSGPVLPSDRVRCLLFAGGLLWIGTDRGLVAIDSAAGVVRSMFTGTRVSRIAESDGVIVAATDAGLRRIRPDRTDDARGEMASPDPALAGRVVDVIDTDDGAWAVAGGRLHAVGPVPSAIRDASLERLGPVLRLAWTDRRLWIAAERGIAVRDGDRWETFRVPEDIPAGPVFDVLAVGDDVWAATPAGAVRLRWR